ncbi:MAG: 1-acyl-sn-glycerol-3-phosphate acyltransferase [Cyclobacteriaceae bacterium]|nr:1-acyl-sn-glycerol-3-phosphate acyltransferase [Cyclobacteriaceae bacterium]
MLYFILSIVIRIALKIFYKRITIHGVENIPKQGPIIVVGNHPNTFMDPILAALIMLPRQVHFLANGSIFKTGIARWGLSYLNAIPVYRKQDEISNRDEKNLAAFQTCFDFLGSGGILLIFPEGNSINERKLRPIRTGTARIALGTQDQHNFNLPLTILPVGLNYSNPTRFRESVVINIGQSFTVNEYHEHYQRDSQAAVLSLTADLQQRMSELIVVTDDREEDDLVRKIELIYKKQFASTNRQPEINLTQNIVKAVNYFQEHNPMLVREVKEKIDQYFNTIKEFNISDYLVEKSEAVGRTKLVRYLTYLVSGFPLYISGLVFNYIPYSIPAKIARWISSDEEYKAPIMMTSGIFTFPIFYGLILFLSWILFSSTLITVTLTIVMPVSGLFALHYYKRLKNFRSTLTYYQYFRKNKSIIDWFTQQRQEIISLLESARFQYE